MEAKKRSPLILATGRTGSGKSTIFNNISGGTTNFKCGESQESITDDYTMKEVHWVGNSNESLLICYDSIGYEDNRTIDAKFLTKTQKLLENLNEGLNILLILVPIDSSLRECYVSPINTTLNLLGKNVIPNILLVFTQVNDLNNKLRNKYKSEFDSEKVRIALECRGVKLKSSQIIYYENNEDATHNLIKKLKDMIETTLIVIPETSTLVMRNLHKETTNLHGLRDNAIHFVGENHIGLNLSTTLFPIQ